MILFQKNHENTRRQHKKTHCPGKSKKTQLLDELREITKRRSY
jgi:hypothetical protein